MYPSFAFNCDDTSESETKTLISPNNISNKKTNRTKHFPNSCAWGTMQNLLSLNKTNLIAGFANLPSESSLIADV